MATVWRGGSGVNWGLARLPGDPQCQRECLGQHFALDPPPPLPCPSHTSGLYCRMADFIAERHREKPQGRDPDEEAAWPGPSEGRAMLQAPVGDDVGALGEALAAVGADVGPLAGVDTLVLGEC